MWPPKRKITVHLVLKECKLLISLFCRWLPGCMGRVWGKAGSVHWRPSDPSLEWRGDRHQLKWQTADGRHKGPDRWSRKVPVSCDPSNFCFTYQLLSGFMIRFMGGMIGFTWQFFSETLFLAWLLFHISPAKAYLEPLCLAYAHNKQHHTKVLKFEGHLRFHPRTQKLGPPCTTSTTPHERAVRWL